MSAIDHDYIYLQPPCCADEDVGRLWCEDPDPTDCDDGKHWTKYVRSDIYEALRSRVAELEAICENVPEGCTPADARVLREANHAFAAEVAQAKWHKDIAEGALASVEQERDELRAKCAELESRLTDAATSLYTIATQAGRDEYMEEFYEVRAYARSRAICAGHVNQIEREGGE